MFFKASVLCNFLLGLLGIGLAFLHRGRTRVWFWLMVGSGVSLCVPLVHHLLVLLLSRLHLFGGYGVLMNTYLPVAEFHVNTRWIAYALLFFGVWDLRFDRSEPSLAGATLPAHPSVASDVAEEAGDHSTTLDPPGSHDDARTAGSEPLGRRQ